MHPLPGICSTKKKKKEEEEEEEEINSKRGKY